MPVVAPALPQCSILILGSYQAWGFTGASEVKNLAAMQVLQGDTILIPGSERSPGGGHGNPLHYSCLENPIDRGARQATVHRVTKSRTRLK